MTESKKLINYAVVENGIITNVLVFDDESTAMEFGCYPLTPYQGIGDAYITPEKYKQQEFQSNISNIINEV